MANKYLDLTGLQRFLSKIKNLLDQKADANNVYTKTEIDEKISVSGETLIIK